MKEAATRSRFSYRVVQAAVKSRELPAFRRGTRKPWRIRIEDLERWMEGHADGDGSEVGPQDETNAD